MLELKRFKEKFTARLTKISLFRKSHASVPKHFRRMDSFARLLETDATCAAVYFDSEKGELWLANNKVHEGSHENNGQIKQMKMIFNLVSDEHLSIDDITEKLAEIIQANFASTKRYDFAVLKKKEFNVEKFIREQLKDLFKSSLRTKEWREKTIETLEEDEDLTKELTLIIKKISRLTRDFLKLRHFLLKNNGHDPLASGILKAIRGKKFKIIHSESKDVHAEMRHIAECANGYIGISKLCCDHCAVAMDAFGVQSRGLHGQRGKWPLPLFIRNDVEKLKRYMGDDAYKSYTKLSKTKQQEAIQYIESKESNPTNENAKHGREMEADSSVSDLEFGLDCTDEEEAETVNDSPLKAVWQWKDIKGLYPDELERLQKLRLSQLEIVELYGASVRKFETMGTRDVFNLVISLAEKGNEGSKDEIFARLSEIYDENKNLFWRLVDDEDDLAIKFGLEEVCNKYYAKARNNAEYYDPEFDDYDSYLEAGAELFSEHGWDYSHDSQDSQNCWKHKDHDSTSENSDSGSNHSNSHNCDSDDDSEDDSVIESIQHSTTESEDDESASHWLRPRSR